MPMFRGLLGATARQAHSPEDPMNFGVVAEPVATPAPAPVAMTTPEANPEKSYLGGLIKYRRPEGQTGAERMAIIGATLRDVGSGLQGGGGGSLEAVQEAFRARQAKTEKESLLKRLETMAAELYPDDDEARLLFKMNPEAFVEQRLKAREPQKPVVVNTRLGPRLYDPKTGAYKVLEDIPDKTPFGWVRDEETGALSIDPAFVAGQGRLADTRAAAAAAHRAPPRPRASTAAPAASSGGVPPWKRTW